jgi:hypothetical protein
MGVQVNEDRWGVIDHTFDPASVAANTSAEQTTTVNGLTTDMVVIVQKPTASAGIGIVNARVSAANTLAVTFMNATASPVNAGAESYRIWWFKPERNYSPTDR